MCENRVLVLPVNILMVWRASFTWPHNTLLCVLIIDLTNSQAVEKMWEISCN